MSIGIILEGNCVHLFLLKLKIYTSMILFVFIVDFNRSILVHNSGNSENGSKNKNKISSRQIVLIKKCNSIISYAINERYHWPKQVKMYI